MMAISVAMADNGEASDSDINVSAAMIDDDDSYGIVKSCLVLF